MGMVDLGHYVLKSSFTVWEIACLVAGVDPATVNRKELEKEPVWGKIKVVEGAIFAAREDARRSLFTFIDSLGPDAMDRDEVSLSDEFGLAPWEEGSELSDGDEGYISCPYGLPCAAIFNLWYARDTRLSPDLVPIENPLFSRNLVRRWLLKKGYKNACYFIGADEKTNSTDEVSDLRARVLELEHELASMQESKASNAAAQTPMSSGLSFLYVTEGLKLVAEVQARYLGENFDPNDKDSLPSQQSILDWLGSARGVESDFERKAIDRIAMPFSRARHRKNPRD